MVKFDETDLIDKIIQLKEMAKTIEIIKQG